MSNRLVALATLIALALPSVAEAGALCGAKRGYGWSAPRAEAPVRLAKVPDVIRIIREERVAPRPPSKAPSIKITAAKVPVVAPIVSSEARDATPAPAAPSVSASVSVTAVGDLAGSQAESGR